MCRFCLFVLQADLAGRAMSKAQEVGGFVRVISRSDGGHVVAEVGSVLRDMDNGGAASAEEMMESLSGFVQVQHSFTCFCRYFLLFAFILNFDICTVESSGVDLDSLGCNSLMTHLCCGS